MKQLKQPVFFVVFLIRKYCPYFVHFEGIFLNKIFT